MEIKTAYIIGYILGALGIIINIFLSSFSLPNWLIISIILLIGIFGGLILEMIQAADIA